MDMPDTPKPRELAEIVEAILEKVPLYQDAIQPGMQEAGKTAGSGLGFVNALLAPLRMMTALINRGESKFLASLEEKTNSIPPERLQSPPLHIAGPALQAMMFTEDEPSLRELYANLLAKAMDTDTVRNVHPTFVETIKQLTSDEARIMAVFAKQETVPIISVESHSISASDEKDSGYYFAWLHFSLLADQTNCQQPDLIQIYLDNLCRLGLTVFRDDVFLSNKDVYAPLENHPIIEGLLAQVVAENRSPIIRRQFIQTTFLGDKFCEICIASNESET